MVAYKHVIVASHQRSGTHLTIDLLRANFQQMADDYINLDRLLPSHKKEVGPEEFRTLINGVSKIHILKSHTTPGLGEFSKDKQRISLVQQIKEESKIVYVYRDGRDVLTSLYHLEKHMVPRPPEKTFSEFLKAPNVYFNAAGLYGACGWSPDVSNPEAWARHVSEWTDTKGCLGVSYEELTTDPDATLRKIATFLDLPVPPSVRRVELTRPSLLLRIFRRITGTQFSSSAVQPRKGVVGDWVNHFSKDDETLFWKIAGPAMERLGYRQ